jgi:histidyl-tRNA synthetase
VVACPPGQEAQALAMARELRAEGLVVEVDLLGRTGEVLLAYARSRGARMVEPAGGAARQPVRRERWLRPALVDPIH